MSAFSYFDKDGSGYITIDEIQQACKDFGLGDVHLDEMIKEIDQDNVSIFFCLAMSTESLLDYMPASVIVSVIEEIETSSLKTSLLKDYCEFFCAGWTNRL